ncbi:hypothetical protein FE257_002503 [Aspergillus nanangensis]|uniref:Deoxyribonuclease NucA/NucB domain-containing protein n=1 Tax=Aspergillus nanangensis TaxID=2582783 RepID=A0AAD4CUS4_ASPNN|nr:hypothetical protein FE257_002503 [Aspergillus nanangensis]
MRPILVALLLFSFIVCLVQADDGEYIAASPFGQSDVEEDGGYLDDSDGTLDERSVLDVLTKRQRRHARRRRPAALPNTRTAPWIGRAAGPAGCDAVQENVRRRDTNAARALGLVQWASYAVGRSAVVKERFAVRIRKDAVEQIRRTSTTTTTSKKSKTSTISCKNTPTIDIEARAVVATGVAEAGLEARNAPEKRQAMKDAMKLYCEQDDEDIPVMYFPLIPGRTEELIRSTCGGIGGGSEVLLHWAKDGKTRDRRKTAGCKDYCKKRGEEWSDEWHDRNECDEFPPASTTEGGDPNCHKMCIPWFQNSLGGSMIWSYATTVYSLKKGQAFIIRVIPGCEYLEILDELERRETDPEMDAQIRKGLEVLDQIERRQSDTTQLSNSSSSWYEDPRIGAKDGYGWIFNGIFDAPDGEYSMNIGLSQQVEQLAIIDGNGDEYLSETNPDKDGSYSITVEDATDLSIVAYGKKEDDIKISYSAQVAPLAANTATSAPTATTSSSTGSVASLDLVIGSLVGVAIVVALFC